MLQLHPQVKFHSYERFPMKNVQNQSRRDMMKLAALSAGAMTFGFPSLRSASAASQDDAPPTPGIALQLYSVRGDCGENFDAALERVAGMGFDAVEFAGYHTYSGKGEELKSRLDDLGLKAAATHIGTGSFDENNLQQTIDFHQAIGCKYLCVPGDGRFSKPDGSKELAEIFNKVAEQLKEVDMKCGYHNHTHEFNVDPDENKTYWELFAERTSEDVVLQQDVGWTVAAGQDPVALIRKYAGRSQVLHFKPTVVGDDEGLKPIIGQDSVPWAPIITAAKEAGATEWFTIEQERYLPGRTPMECTELSLAGLKDVLCAM
jgi:sugar phosphate isomerase/epimerase